MTRTGSTCKLRCPGPSVNEPIAGLMPRSLPMQLDYRGARCNEGRGAIPAVHAGENHTIQIALVGCGGRGTGAAANALATKSGPVKLVAMADVFEHRLKSSYETLTSIGGDAGNGSPDRAVAGYDPAQVDVPPDRRFLGFDAYKKAMDCLRPGDVVLLTTPCAFWWVHFDHAIDKGINVFMEKPTTVDGPSTRKMLALAERSARKNLKVGMGLMCRHCDARKALLERLRGPIFLMSKPPISGYEPHKVPDPTGLQVLKKCR